MSGSFSVTQRVRQTAIVLFTSIFLILPGAVQAAVQRMGIAAGSYELAARTAQAVPAFCFDLTRASPSANSSFSEVLTPSSNAVVKIGSETMSLQEAIRARKIEIRGTQPTMQQIVSMAGDPVLRKRMSPSQRAEADQMSLEWSKLTAAGRAHIEREMAPIFAEMGDHTQLRLVNLTDQPVSVRMGANTIFGGSEDKGSRLSAEHITTGKPQREVQASIWSEMTKQHQVLLIETGYLKGPADGALGEKTELAIAKFQVVHGLPPTAEIDAATENALRASANDNAIANTLNGPGNTFTTVLVESVAVATGGRALYRLSLGGGRAGYSDTIEDISKTVTRLLGRQPVGDVYLVPRGVPDNVLTNLTTSTRIRHASADGGPELRVIDAPSGLADHEFLKRGVTGIELSGDVTRTTDGQFGQGVNFEHASGPPTKVTFVARTRGLLLAFLENLRSVMAQFAGVRAAGLPSATILHVALERTRASLNMSPAEFHQQIRAELGSVQVARRDQPTLTTGNGNSSAHGE